MQSTKWFMKQKLIGYSLFFVALILGFWYFLFKDTDVFTRSTLLQRGVVNHFSFTNQDGLQFTNLDIAGKVCVSNYFFTTCRGICPRMNNNMRKVYEAFKDNPDVMILSHSCNPERDSVSVMKHYADSMKVNTRQWVFLTGRKDSLYNTARFSYGIDDPKNAVNKLEDDFIHTQFFALIDRNGKVRGGVYDGLKEEEVNKLISDIKSLLKEKPDHFVNGVFNN